MLKEAEKLHLKALDISKNLIGEKSLLTAKAYCNLGRLYQTQQRHLVIFFFYFTIIEQSDISDYCYNCYKA